MRDLASPSMISRAVSAGFGIRNFPLLRIAADGVLVGDEFGEKGVQATEEGAVEGFVEAGGGEGFEALLLAGVDVSDVLGGEGASFAEVDQSRVGAVFGVGWGALGAGLVRELAQGEISDEIGDEAVVGEFAFEELKAHGGVLRVADIADEALGEVVGKGAGDVLDDAGALAFHDGGRDTGVGIDLAVAWQGVEAFVVALMGDLDVRRSEG